MSTFDSLFPVPTGGRNADDMGLPPAPKVEAALRAPAERSWKQLKDEFLPFHPDASHVPPDFRDGWNACYRLATPQPPTPQAPAATHIPTEEQIGKHVLRAGDCPPDSQVLLVSSVKRLQARAAAQAPAVAVQNESEAVGVVAKLMKPDGSHVIKALLYTHTDGVERDLAPLIRQQLYATPQAPAEPPSEARGELMELVAWLRSEADRHACSIAHRYAAVQTHINWLRVCAHHVAAIAATKEKPL
jgi:hypothetical protein